VQCTHLNTERQTGGACGSTDSTGQPHRGGGGADCTNLAAGELAGGEVTTSGFPAKWRTQRASLRHWRSSRVSSTAGMVVHRRGSPAVRRSRPWRRKVRCARGSRAQGGREIEEKWREGEERSSSHGGPSSVAMAPPWMGNACPGLTAAKTRVRACTRNGGGPGRA
jgi:hypothetical protein